jgi:hypothetical protein
LSKSPEWTMIAAFLAADEDVPGPILVLLYPKEL